jgi:hypothetical protein
MKNRNKFDAMLDVIEAGDTESLEQQNALHLSQMKTLLDNHLVQQRSILNKFRESTKANSSEMMKLREETAKERKVLAKTLSEHETQIDRLSSYSEGVFLSRRVYNMCLTIFICSLTANAVLVTLAVIILMSK